MRTSTECYSDLSMFLAKTWSKRNGKKYEAWVLKSAIWDKETKRMKQKYLAYIGKTKSISLDKALQICEKLNISLDELKRVKRLRVLEPKSLAEVMAERKPETPRYSAITAAMMIRELRDRYKIPATPEGYQMLAMRIGVLHINAKQLQEAESTRRPLNEEQMERLEKLVASRK